MMTVVMTRDIIIILRANLMMILVMTHDNFQPGPERPALWQFVQTNVGWELTGGSAGNIVITIIIHIIFINIIIISVILLLHLLTIVTILTRRLEGPGSRLGCKCSKGFVGDDCSLNEQVNS